MPLLCGIMDDMSDETRARLVQASQVFAGLQSQLNEARTVLVAAIVEDRKAGGLIEDITAVVPYRQTHVNRILKDAGLTEERKRHPAAA